MFKYIAANRIKVNRIVKVTKAKEVLRRYAAGEKDFQGLNLSGQSLRGANLSGADFSSANFSNTKLYSTNFASTNLTNANFTGAECGLQKRNITLLLCLGLCLIFILEISLFISVHRIVSILDFNNGLFLVLFSVAEFFLISYCIEKVLEGLRSEPTTKNLIIFIGATIGIGFFIMAIVVRLSQPISQIDALKLLPTGALFGIVLSGMTVITANAALLAEVLVLVVLIFTEIIFLYLIYSLIGIPAFFISFAAKAATNYIGIKLVKKSKTFIHSYAISNLTSQGTSFYKADLTKANFSKARLKGANFSKANITGVCWKDTKMSDSACFNNTYLKHNQTNKKMKTIKIFLASSSELQDDRKDFEIFISRKNDEYIDEKKIRLKLVIWENFIDAMSATRLQDEYNKAIQDCDIFVSLFHTKVGRYTEEEFSKAWETFNTNGKPSIYTYFKDEAVKMSKITTDIISWLNFRQKLKDLGHYPTFYDDINDLKYKFTIQLSKLLNDGKI